MRKIAIVTLNGYFNYGNRLQNYAMQRVLESQGFNVETVITRAVKQGNKAYMQRAIRLLKRPPGEICARVYRKICAQFRRNEPCALKEERTGIFKEFTLNHIRETDYSVSGVDIPRDLSNRYDYFVTGSDQVWNPSYLGGSGAIYFLSFAEKSKRISYAPSFGISTIPAEHKEQYKEWVSGIYKLSVREDDGARIIKELTGIEAPVLVDPTLLLTKEKWLAIAKAASRKPDRQYLLTYFLGRVPVNYRRQIQSIAEKSNLEVVNLGDINDKGAYLTGPSEFIDYIDSCSIFCTDSFHGVVFSILMQKPFIAYKRIGSYPSMFSRIDTLLDKFKLNSRKAENIKTASQAFDISYSHVAPLLEVERARSFDYLAGALNTRNAE